MTKSIKCVFMCSSDARMAVISAGLVIKNAFWLFAGGYDKSLMVQI